MPSPTPQLKTGGLESRLRFAVEHGFRDPEQNFNVGPIETQSSKVRKEREVLCRRLMGFDKELGKRDA